jgi:hypothetical protein
MPKRTEVTQITQFGVEATPGVAVPANRRFQFVNLRPRPRAEVETFRPQGTKYHAPAAVLGAEWSESGLSGLPTYTEIVYLLSMIYGTPVITTPGGATSARQWEWSPSLMAEDAIKTLTLENGSAERAHRSTYNLLREFGMTFRRRGAQELRGSVIGRAVTDGITLTASPTTLPIVPIVGKQISVYIDNSAAALGTTKMLDVYRAGFTFGNRFDTYYPLDASFESFAGHAETEPTTTVELLLAADAAGMGMLAAMRAGDTKFIRIEAVGPLIESGQNYRFRHDCAAQVTEPQDFGNENGLTVMGFNFTVVHDPTWAAAHRIRVVNALTAL